jgi:hypothetical protein
MRHFIISPIQCVIMTFYAEFYTMRHYVLAAL